MADLIEAGIPPLAVTPQVRAGLTELPVLLRRYMPLADPLRERFARLTAQEERAGLLANLEAVATRAEWEHLLAERGFALRGYRLGRGRGGIRVNGQLRATVPICV